MKFLPEELQKPPTQLPGEYVREYYEKKSDMQMQHYVTALRLLQMFKPTSVLDFGCGTGMFMRAFRYYGVMKIHGFEIKEECKEFAHESIKDSIAFSRADLCRTYDMIFCWDVLEHMWYEEEAEKAIKFLAKKCRRFAVFSICMVGDPNYRLDGTHRLYRTRSWWEHKLKKAGFKIIPTPKDMWFAQQIILCEKIKRRETIIK